MTTILDLARISGLSKSTVSRVLNQHPHVSQESKEKVEKAIEQIGYKRNARGVHLRKKQNQLIGLLVPTVNHPYFSQLISALSEACRKSGYETVIYQSGFQPKEERYVYDKLAQQEMDALVVTHTLLSEQEIKELVGNRIVIICNEQTPGVLFDVFSVDEEQAIFDATTYLLQQGRTRLLLCMDYEQTPLQQKRLSGFKRALKNAEISYSTNMKRNKIMTIDDGLRLGDQLFQAESYPDGLLTGSDFVAMGLLHSAQKHSINIPSDVSIIGFDNHSIGRASIPLLTTIDYPLQSIADDVAKALALRVNQNEVLPRRNLYKATLILRETT